MDQRELRRTRGPRRSRRLRRTRWRVHRAAGGCRPTHPPGPELARDAVQEAFIRAWRDLPGLRDPERFDAWLHRLTVNACLDAVRRRKRRLIEVELSPTMPFAGSAGDEASHIADRDQLERGFRRLGADHAGGAGPALLPRHVRVGGCRDPRYPDGHRAIAPTSSPDRAPRRDRGRRASRRRNPDGGRMNRFDNLERELAAWFLEVPPPARCPISPTTSSG